MEKTRIEVIDGEHKGKFGYIDYYHWDSGIVFCVVVLAESIECLYLYQLRPIHVPENW